MSLRLDWCSYEAAKFACEKWHYSKTTSSAANNYIGVWEDDKFIGCIIFGIGATHNIGRPYNLRNTECIELTRVALNGHKSPVTKIISISIKLLLKKNPGLKLLVSYADLNQSHVGTIYQAGNWVYVGTANDYGGSYIINGKKIHGRTIGSKYGTRSLEFIRTHIDPNAAVYQSKGKHKYLYPLTDDMRSQIEPLRKPYPKRASVVHNVEQPAYQQEEGGSIPTLTHTL